MPSESVSLGHLYRERVLRYHCHNRWDATLLLLVVLPPCASHLFSCSAPLRLTSLQPNPIPDRALIHAHAVSSWREHAAAAAASRRLRLGVRHGHRLGPVHAGPAAANRARLLGPPGAGSCQTLADTSESFPCLWLDVLVASSCERGRAHALWLCFSDFLLLLSASPPLCLSASLPLSLSASQPLSLSASQRVTWLRTLTSPPGPRPRVAAAGVSRGRCAAAARCHHSAIFVRAEPKL